MSSAHTDGAWRDDDNIARIIELALEKLDNDLTFIDTVIFYKIADISIIEHPSATPSEVNFGLFYSGDDYWKYEAKPVAYTIYSYFNGSTDCSAIDDLVARYK